MAPPAAGEGDEGEREDELPTVVVLEKEDVGEEEYKKFREVMKELSACHIMLCGRCIGVIRTYDDTASFSKVPFAYREPGNMARTR